MDVSYNELKSKEIVNLSDGSKMGHIVDVLFDNLSGKISGIVVPGQKRIFRKNDELFIPLEKVRRIGDDVILVRFDYPDSFTGKANNSGMVKYYKNTEDTDGSFIRYKRFDNKKYK